MEPLYYPEEDTYRIYCPVCNKFCIDIYYPNHLKSQTHLNKLRQKNLTIK